MRTFVLSVRRRKREPMPYKMNKPVAIVRESRSAPAKSYTVSNLTALSRSYIEEARQVWAEGDVVETELQLSLFLAWLQKREPNGDDRRA